MLGERISDPNGIESGGNIRGMGLLPMETIFTGEKTRTRVKGKFTGAKGVLDGINGLEFEGYEIHMGETRRTERSDKETVMTEITDTVTGERKTDGFSKENVYGTYVHGILDKDKIVVNILDALAKKKGIVLESEEGMDLEEFKETQYDLLASVLREHMDMKAIYDMISEFK